jgi:hypothetical protein
LHEKSLGKSKVSVLLPLRDENFEAEAALPLPEHKKQALQADIDQH